MQTVGHLTRPRYSLTGLGVPEAMLTFWSTVGHSGKFTSNAKLSEQCAQCVSGVYHTNRSFADPKRVSMMIGID